MNPRTFLLLAGLFTRPLFLYAAQESAILLNPTTPHAGRLLFLLQQGEDQQALRLYQATFQASGQHDFEVLHQIGLSVLEHGFQRSDPESQLLALFGASISAHEEAYRILEESAKSRYPEIQLIALQALAHFQNDRADKALLRALGAPSLQVRYEAVHQLCKKKHPQAASHAESLMYKTPVECWALFPPLFAMIGDPHSTQVLRRLRAHSSTTVRLSAIISIAKYEREDLLPQIRQQLAHLSFAEQEASVYACGCLKDESSIPKLEKLTRSPYSTVSLAAFWALYQLGKPEIIQDIEEAARQEDLFAITILGSLPDHSHTLLELVKQSDLLVRLNASLSLLEQRHPEALGTVEEFLIRDKRDLAFIPCHSPGRAFKAWKAVMSGTRLFEEHPEALRDHAELKESILEKVREIDAEHFIALAHRIFIARQQDLIPKTTGLLEEMGSPEAIACLKEHQQQPGAPLVRHYCNLALYRLQEPGPYGQLLREWVEGQSQTELIRFAPIETKEWDRGAYTLTPEESSKLLVDALQAFAAHQDTQGIETLIEVMANGHVKNKYALAGLLLRATQ